MQCLATKLKVWNLKVFGNVSDKVKQVKESVKIAKSQFDRLYDQSKILFNQSRVTHTRAILTEVEFWRQKVTIRWLKAGDCLTSTHWFDIKGI